MRKPALPIILAVVALTACGADDATMSTDEIPCRSMLANVYSWTATTARGAHRAIEVAMEADAEADHEAIRVMNDFLETLEGTPVSPSFQDAANRFPFDMVAALAQDTDAIRKARRDAVDDFVANVRAEIAAGEFYLDTCRGVPGHPPESLSDYIDGQRALLTDLDALSN